MLIWIDADFVYQVLQRATQSNLGAFIMLPKQSGEEQNSEIHERLLRLGTILVILHSPQRQKASPS